MIRCNPLLRRPIAENPAVLLVLASHKTKTFFIVSGCQPERLFPQPARQSLLGNALLHLSEDPGKVVQKLSGHLWMVHASDKHGQYDEHLAPGEGDIDWCNLLLQLSRMHFAGTIILELAERGDRAATLQAARRGRSHIRNLSHGLRLQT
jgi:hypothetical protein